MKSFNRLIILLSMLLFLHSGTFPQNSNDFLISSSGSCPSLAYNLHGGTYVVWDNPGDAVHLKHFDSTGAQLDDSITFAKTYASFSPKIIIGSKFGITVWNDRLSNIIDFFNSYIDGYFFSENSIHGGNYWEFNNQYGDAIRGNPDAGFLNDTTVIVAWDGNGDSTIVNYAIYGQGALTSGNKLGDNFLIVDHIHNNVDSGRPRIIYSQGNNFFLVTG